MSTHFDSNGNARMVDVSAKGVTVREAVASGQLVMAEATAKMIRGGNAKKGDVLGVARLAAIQGSKQTATLIPLCHSIPIEAVSVDFEWIDPVVFGQSPSVESPSVESPSSESLQAGASTETLRCVVRVRTSGKTGVEMEALTAVSIACLAVYDMVKSVDRGIVIGPLRLEEKSGGKSGDFRRKPGNSC
ncbi:MAG: cyclic pyranopterin monophosphate synthase MoaC [Rubripirellula sp.]